MNCDEIKAVLRERFDAGTTLASGLESHLAACGSCQKYCDRLAALDGALAALPLEPLPEDFGGRVHARIEEHAFRRRTAERLSAGFTATATIAGLLVAGWYYPINADPRRWLETARAWLPEVFSDWRGTLQAINVQAQTEWERLLEGLERTVPVPSLLLWPTLFGFLLFLLVFNAVEAHRMNGTRGGS